MLCHKCHKDKPIECFNTKDNKRGYAYQCRQCYAEYKREWTLRNKDRVKTDVQILSEPLSPRLKALQDSIMAGRKGYVKRDWLWMEREIIRRCV